MEDFEKMIKDGLFLEHAQFSGNRYGTRWKFLMKILIFIIYRYYYMNQLLNAVG